MTLDTLEVPKSVATKKLDAVRRELKRRRKPIDDELSRLEKAYEAAAEGTPLIQLGRVIEAGGFFDNGLPRIAIARSDRDRVHVERPTRDQRRVVFEWTRWARKSPWTRDRLEVRTLHDMPPRDRERGTTMVPLVPPDALEAAGVLRSRLGDHYTLFEVEEWKPVPPVDPALLRWLAGDLYAVLAVWDLTDLERAVIAGTR